MTFEKFIVSRTEWRKTHRGIEVLRTMDKEMFLEDQRESRWPEGGSVGKGFLGQGISWGGSCFLKAKEASGPSPAFLFMFLFLLN